MEIEKEAFEKAFAQTEFYRNKADLYSLLADIDDETFDFFRKNGFGDYSIGEAQAAWSAWQAAKAQAVPDGFVLMPKEPTQEIIQAGLDVVRESWDDNPPHGFNSFMWGDMVATWEAMIEAQEPAND